MAKFEMELPVDLMEQFKLSEKTADMEENKAEYEVESSGSAQNPNVTDADRPEGERSTFAIGIDQPPAYDEAGTEGLEAFRKKTAGAQSNPEEQKAFGDKYSLI